jgi:hypothetical protein
VISDFSTDRQMLSRKLDEIDAGGGTALYDALGYVLSEPLKRLRGERTAIVVMSDGDDNKSFLPFPAILEALSESGALVYPLYVPSGLIPESSVPRPEITIDPLRTRYLTLTTRADEEGRKLAAASGGIYYPIRGSRICKKRTTTWWPSCVPLTRSLTRRIQSRRHRVCACARIATALRCG